MTRLADVGSEHREEVAENNNNNNSNDDSNGHQVAGTNSQISVHGGGYLSYTAYMGITCYTYTGKDIRPIY